MPIRCACTRTLIAQLDREPQLVEIQVTIIDVDRSKLKDLGFDYRFNDGRNSINAGGGDPGPQNGGLLLNTVLGNAGNFLARINALAKDGSAQVVSRPQVLTLSNLEAVLATDQSFFVRVAGERGGRSVRRVRRHILARRAIGRRRCRRSADSVAGCHRRRLAVRPNRRQHSDRRSRDAQHAGGHSRRSKPAARRTGAR